MIKSYKNLLVWQKSFELAIEVYKITDLFPKSELYGLTNQIRRVAVAIPSNIAEGFARKYRKEYIQFISIAYASGAELETQLLIAKTLKFSSDEKFEKVFRLLEEIMKMLNGLLRKLRTTNG